jgi:hypothetical protein
VQMESPLLRVLLWIAEYFCRFVAGLAAGVLAGYASHLTLDFFHPGVVTDYLDSLMNTGLYLSD